MLKILTLTVCFLFILAQNANTVPNTPISTPYFSYSDELKNHLEELKSELKTISNLRSSINVLRWDQQVNLPKGSTKSRSNQLSILSGILHDFSTNKKLGDLIRKTKKLAISFNLHPMDASLLSLAEKDFVKVSLLPKDLIQEVSVMESEAVEIWIKARAENDFNLMIPIIQKWIQLKKKMSSFLNPKKDAYEVLLDEFDSGMTIAKIDEMFQNIKLQVVPFIRKVLDQVNSIKIDDGFLYGNFSIKDQESLNKIVTAQLGFSYDHGRLDISAHPMCIPISKSDVRMTTRYQPDNFHKSFIPSIHESGHGIYEQQLNVDYYGTPVGEPQGNSFHESQSILYERHVGLSKPFWKHVWPIVKNTFGSIPSYVTADQAYRAINQVRPGFIRVESDELTYMMHIIMRYEIERSLFNGSLEIQDIPKVWNEKMSEYLGIVPPTNTLGALQDIHWSLGYFGYFPSYLCGQMMASQIYSQAKLELDGLENQVENGKFTELTRWLGEKVHSKGKVMDFDPLLEEITGSPLTPKYLIDYVVKKYSEIYKIKE